MRGLTIGALYDILKRWQKRSLRFFVVARGQMHTAIRANAYRHANSASFNVTEPYFTANPASHLCLLSIVDLRSHNFSITLFVIFRSPCLFVAV